MTSNLVDGISASIDEGPAGPTDRPTRTLATMLHRAATGSGTVDAETVPPPRPRPLTTTPGQGCRQLIGPPCPALGRNIVTVIGRDFQARERAMSSC